jgi:hypothetical protein
MFASLRKLFAGSPVRPVARHQKTTRLSIEALDGRALMAVLVGPALEAPKTEAAAPALVSVAKAGSNTLGNNVANYLRNHLGDRVGGGECAHIATAALRAAGADFTHTYYGSNTEDYDWGTQVARLTSGSQLAGKQFQVGDIIQYTNAKFSSGGTSKLAHHTQVVAAVDSNGRITKVYEQNIGGDRTVRLSNILDLSKLNGGSVTIYRAEARTTAAGKYEFTVVNNTGSSQTVTGKIGSFSLPQTLTKANTANSYKTWSLSTSGSSKPTISVGGTSFTVSHGGAYELYMSNGRVAIRSTTLG